MAYMRIGSQNMRMMTSVMTRKIWQTAQDSVSQRSFRLSHLANESAVEPINQDVDLSGSSLISSLKTNGNIMRVASLVKEDTKRIQQHCIRILREHIKSDEMYNIATYYYKNKVNPFFVWSSTFLLLTKALKYHINNDGSLTKEQEKIIALIELSIASYLLHDDIGDDSPIRFRLPSAHLIWNPYKVVVAGNMMLAIIVNEAAKLSNADYVSQLCLAHDRQYQGQFMENTPKFIHGDRLGNYLSTIENKAGSPNSYWFTCVAKAVGASARLTDIVNKLGFNNSMFLQLVDDINDVKEDLGDGHATATVIFASKEHPILEDMIMRKFQEDGDVEKAMELVNNSKAREEARILAERYFANSLVFMDLLADSPFLDGLKTVFQFQFQRKMNGV